MTAGSHTTTHLVTFKTWSDLLAHAQTGARLWYAAPMDAASKYPARTVRATRVYKNGKVRIDPLNNTLGSFTADSTQLSRFRAEQCCFDDCDKYAVERKQYRDAKGAVYAVRAHCAGHSGHA